MPLKKKEYYRIEAIRIMLSPILLFVIAWFSIQQGWIHESQVPIVWTIILLETSAHFLAVILVYFASKF